MRVAASLFAALAASCTTGRGRGPVAARVDAATTRGSVSLRCGVTTPHDRVPWASSHVDARMPCTLHRRLLTALELASDAVRREPACSVLFTRLGADPEALLRSGRFRVANARHETTICPRAEAFTVVGGRTTALCRSFADLADLDAAAVILHETLHHAGRTEYPLDPDAPTSTEITELVRARCGLDSGR